jgi:serine/threonine-protein kinase
MTISIGSMLKNRYLIQDSIGKGGMGAIWLAADNRLEGRVCAVKEIVRDHSATTAYHQQARTQFHREASILARLDHPNLPKVSDFFTDQDTDILIMDYVDGEDLRQKIDTQNSGAFLEETEVLGWAYQILEALEYLHLQDPPVVHRDIKPSNIKVNNAGIIKLVDFGLVKVMTPEERTVTIVQGRGTIHYTPIEQYGGDAGHTDLRSDIYSLGCTLYHLLTNRPPPEAKLRFLQADSMTLIRTINPNISPRTERAIHWALSLHPEDRPESTNAFRSALFEGLFPDEKGVPEYMPESSREWVQHALADPLHRDLAIVSTLLIILAVITTFTA